LFVNTDTEFFTTKGVPAQILYLIFATSLVRLKYYHAWLLADAIANASGLGLRVPSNPKEQPSWDLISNIDVIGFEVRKRPLSFLLFCGWNEFHRHAVYVSSKMVFHFKIAVLRTKNHPS
jgi:hypothetical protein